MAEVVCGIRDGVGVLEGERFRFGGGEMGLWRVSGRETSEDEK